MGVKDDFNRFETNDSSYDHPESKVGDSGLGKGLLKTESEVESSIVKGLDVVMRSSVVMVEKKPFP